MKDDEYNALRERLTTIRERWYDAIVPGGFYVTYAYDRTGDEFEDARGGRRSTAAKCNVKWQYLIATITYNMPELASWSMEDLEEMVVHEHMHILVNEMRGKPSICQDSEERVCSQLQRAFVKVRRYKPVEGEY